MSEFPACVLIVTAEVDPQVEAEWNRWYDRVHVPDVLACPGVHGGRRYVSSGEASLSENGERRAVPRKMYTTVYEITGPEALQTPQFLAMRGWHQFAPHVRSSTQVFMARGDQRAQPGPG
ncbi:MAG: hypothetical protein KIT36_21830 [Alphaproteobacteria bacterium]|nr:hypothetical protein [Alphaproteobacteria bacterium]